MKKFTFLALVLILFSSCLSPKEASYRSISMEEARKMMETEKDYILLDVRTQDEYEGGHIPGAVNLPLSDITSSPISSISRKDALILVYCRSGNRSKEASRKLVSLGYSNVVEIGGINSWKGEVVFD